MAKYDANTPIPAEKFRFAQMDEKLSDKKLDTKPVGYFKDAWIRFRKNKASVVAFVIIVILVLFAAVGPYLSHYSVTYNDVNMLQKLPKCELFAWSGWWDGCSTVTLSEADYWYYQAIGAETGLNPIKHLIEETDVESHQGTLKIVKRYYKVKMDSYTDDGVIYMTMTKAQYEAVQRYQDEHGVQIIYPAVPVGSNSSAASVNQYDGNMWYETAASGAKKGLP